MEPRASKVLHLTAIPFRSVAAGKLGRQAEQTDELITEPERYGP
jgi:hypothetical protein